MVYGALKTWFSMLITVVKILNSFFYDYVIMRGRIFIIFIQEDSSHRDASDDTDFGAI